LYFKVSTCNNDETFPNFIKIKHPRRKRNKGEGSKSRQANNPKRHATKKTEPVSTEASISHMKT
jgi:hypothetical protein